jgi:hypothetical protein
MSQHQQLNQLRQQNQQLRQQIDQLKKQKAQLRWKWLRDAHTIDLKRIITKDSKEKTIKYIEKTKKFHKRSITAWKIMKTYYNASELEELRKFDVLLGNSYRGIDGLPQLEWTIMKEEQYEQYKRFDGEVNRFFNVHASVELYKQLQQLDINKND